MDLAEGASATAGALGSAAAPSGRPIAVVTFFVWMLTASVGSYMLTTWITRGGLRRRRATGEGPPPPIVFSHFGLAVTGLLVWGLFLLSNWVALAWVAAGLLMPAVGLGIATVTLWTPYPGPSARVGPGPPTPGAAPAGSMFAERAETALAARLTDEMLTRALTDDVLAGRLADMVVASVPGRHPVTARKPRGHLAALIPAGHGVGAIATMVLVMMSVALVR